MRIIIKPMGAVTILAALLVLALLAFRPRSHAAGPDAGAARVSGTPSPPSTRIYDGALENGWQNYGWAKALDWKDTSHARPGTPGCIRVQPGAYEAVYFHHAPYVPQGYDRLTFLINGGDAGGQVVRVSAVFADAAASKTGDNASYAMTLQPLPARTWRSVTFRLADFGVLGRRKLTGFWVQNAGAKPLPAFYIDDVRFLRPGDPAPAAL